MILIHQRLFTTQKPIFWILLILTFLNVDSLFGQKVKYAELTYMSVDTTFMPYSSFDTIFLNDEIFVHPRDTLLAHLNIDSLTYLVSPEHIISHRANVSVLNVYPELKSEIWRFFDLKNEKSFNFKINKQEEIEVKGSWRLYQNWRGHDFSYPDIDYASKDESFLGYSVKEAYCKGAKNKRAVVVKGKFTPDILFKMNIAPPFEQEKYYCPLDLQVEYFLDFHSVKHIQLLKVKALSKKEFKHRVHKYLGTEYQQVFQK